MGSLSEDMTIEIRGRRLRKMSIEKKTETRTESKAGSNKTSDKKPRWSAKKQVLEDVKALHEQNERHRELVELNNRLSGDDKTATQIANEAENGGPGRDYFDTTIQVPWGKIGLVVLLICCLIAYKAYTTIMFDFNRKDSVENPETVSIHVEKGSNLSEISEQLKDAGLIKYGTLFSLYTQYMSGKSNSIQYGDFEFTTDMSYDDMISILCVQQVFTKTITVTFPEGSTAVAIAQIMEQNGLCSVDDFLACANGEDGSDFSQYEFWNLIPEDTGRIMKCEGYLFPDTYEFYVGDSVYNYVNKLYKEFDSKVDDLMMDIDDSNYSLDDIVILGSFIQEEAGKASEDAKVSAVFHNRIESTDPLWASHILQSNTCSYIMNDNENNYLWNSPTAEYMGWRAAGKIPDDILKIYDTYKVEGLPAGPVSNPGYDAIYAALHPDQTFIDEGYYFFVTGNPKGNYPGQYFYAKTAREHQKNVELAGWA